MSTCIYQGFRLNTDSFAEALRLVEAFRPWVNLQAEKRLEDFMRNLVVSGKSPSEARRAWRDLREQSRKDGTREPDVDTDFSISLIPAEGGVQGIVFTEHHDWYTAWCAQPGVEEFSYWDNTDRPTGMDMSHWQARKQAWQVLTGEPVAMQAFSIDLVSPNGPRPKTWL